MRRSGISPVWLAAIAAVGLLVVAVLALIPQYLQFFGEVDPPTQEVASPTASPTPSPSPTDVRSNQDSIEPLVFKVEYEVVPDGTELVFSGMNGPARDLDGDGLLEDINGNGRFDFHDITTFFDNLTSDLVRSNSQAFDFDQNGRVDMGDPTELFAMLVRK